MQKAPSLQVEEISGDEYPDLESVQRAAMPFMAEDLKNVVLSLLEKGVLIKTADGKIIPNPQWKQ